MGSKANWLVNTVICTALGVVLSGCQPAPPPAPPAGAHVPQWVYINEFATPGPIAHNQWAAIDHPTTVNCPGTSGTCTIELQLGFTLYAGFSGGNDAYACPQVDGVFLNDCGYTSAVPADGSPDARTVTFIATVPSGNHTVQAFAWIPFTVWIGRYVTIYRIYQP